MKCSTIGCEKEAAKYRKYCHTCRCRRNRYKNPILYIWHDLKKSAKRRNKTFDITLEQFTEFCHKTDYHNIRGRFADGCSIDRINPDKGYSIENIRIVTVSENSKLRHASLTEEDMQYFPNHLTAPF